MTAARGSATKGLAPAEEALVRISAAMPTGDEALLRRTLEGAVEAASPETVEEILLQSYLFLGFPTALRALALWREVSGLPAADADWEDGGDPGGASADARLGLWSERGAAVCRTVYGSQYEALRANVRELHPLMERWMLEEGYGKVLGRPGASLRVRELAIVAMLAVVGAQVQLYSHLRGALNAGATEAQVGAALDVADGHLSAERRRAARATWSRVRGSG